MQERYEQLLLQLHALLEGERDTVANLSNISALIYHALDNINWAGFYLYKNGELVLGPFQGKPACMHISLARGVCGKAARTLQTQCIGNVHAFEGHIACDGASNSEIVVPILLDGALYGVLDIDSFAFDNFSEVDVTYLGKLVDSLPQYISPEV